jgi:hypothetical protein
VWPIDESASRPPVAWTGWPQQKKFALVLTHDVESSIGQDKSSRLMELEMKLGFRSSFNFVAEKYRVLPELREHLQRNLFEVGVHGLTHDKKLYQSRQCFQEQAARINEYLAEWDSVGFRSPCMYHNLDWMHDLDIEYDASTFDTDPFEPQPDGVGTIFPFNVSSHNGGKGYVELPYTLPQDFTLFNLLKEQTIDIWKKKLDWLSERGGMALLNTHPDYMNFNGSKGKCDEYSVEFYREFLCYLRDKYEDSYWHVLPKEMARFWLTTYGGSRKTHEHHHAQSQP